LLALTIFLKLAAVNNSEVVGVLTQIALYETLLASEHRTTNGDEADFFYVPLLHACIVEQADAAPHLSMQVLSGINTLVVEGTCIFYACELFIHEWMYCQFTS
jgi:hypothetical protein